MYRSDVLITTACARSQPLASTSGRTSAGTSSRTGAEGPAPWSNHDSRRELAVRVDGRDDHRDGTLPLLFRHHRNLAGGTNRSEISGKQRSDSRRKCEVRARKSKLHVGVSINGVSQVEHYF
jgi:hypothetical protein